MFGFPQGVQAFLAGVLGFTFFSAHVMYFMGGLIQEKSCCLLRFKNMSENGEHHVLQSLRKRTAGLLGMCDTCVCLMLLRARFGKRSRLVMCSSKMTIQCTLTPLFELVFVERLGDVTGCGQNIKRKTICIKTPIRTACDMGGKEKRGG